MIGVLGRVQSVSRASVRVVGGCWWGGQQRRRRSRTSGDVLRAMADGAQCGASPAPDLEDISVSASHITTLHDAACARGDQMYIDPATGYKVMTADSHRARGNCCGNGCRHCPFNHASIPMGERADRIKAPALLAGTFAALDNEEDEPIDVLFWSGGKDSFLTARRLVRERGGTSRLLLLTTFDGASRIVGHQQIPISEVVRQAEVLGVPLLGVPLWSHIPYPTRVAEALAFVGNHRAIGRVCFGDLHLEDIKMWRQQQLGHLCAAMGATLATPLWHVPYPDLTHELTASGVPCRVCAVATGPSGEGRVGGGAQIGDLFNADLFARLDPGVDAYGENGEFHTLAEVWNATTGDPLGLLALGE
jgi:diphthamide synthase (EF-2-diphthine--ammonia ligase)